MSVQRFLFSKQNRLTGKKNIETLLSKGEAFFVFPYRIIYNAYNVVSNNDSNLKLVIAVPKRKCKLAVQRNRIKRLTREAYRLQQQILITKIPSDVQMHVMLQYVQSENITQQEAMVAVKKILLKLSKQYEATTQPAIK